MSETEPGRVSTLELFLVALTSDAEQTFVELLSADERKRTLSLRHPEDRAAYVAAHAVLRGALARRLDLPPREIPFRLGETGKPELNLPNVDLSFSLSHSRGLSAVAIGPSGELGVDVEAVSSLVMDADFLDAFLSPLERDYLSRQAAEPARQAATAFWTLKEALAKAMSFGLSASLPSLEFTLQPIGLRGAPSAFGAPRDWRLRQSFFSHHSVALAFRPARPGAIDICLRSVTEIENI